MMCLHRAVRQSLVWLGMAHGRGMAAAAQLPEILTGLRPAPAWQLG